MVDPMTWFQLCPSIFRWVSTCVKSAGFDCILFSDCEFYVMTLPDWNDSSCLFPLLWTETYISQPTQPNCCSSSGC